MLLMQLPADTRRPAAGVSTLPVQPRRVHLKRWQLTDSRFKQERPQVGDGPAFGSSSPTKGGSEAGRQNELNADPFSHARIIVGCATDGKPSCAH